MYRIKMANDSTTNICYESVDGSSVKTSQSTEDSKCEDQSADIACQTLFPPSKKFKSGGVSSCVKVKTGNSKKGGGGGGKCSRDDRDSPPPPKSKGKSSSSGPSVSICMESNMEKSEDLRQKWERLFRESEQFEDTAIDRADALLKDVYALRDALQVEKDALTGRLKNVVGILDK